MRWAKTLVVDFDQTGHRLLIVLCGLRELYGPLSGIVNDIDATGTIGNTWLNRGIEVGRFPTTLDELILLAGDDGQVWDLEVEFEEIGVEITVIKGGSIDVLGSDERILPLLEPYEDLDPTWFDWIKGG